MARTHAISTHTHSDWKFSTVNLSTKWVIHSFGGAFTVSIWYFKTKTITNPLYLHTFWSIYCVQNLWMWCHSEHSHDCLDLSISDISFHSHQTRTTYWYTYTSTKLSACGSLQCWIFAHFEKHMFVVSIYSLNLSNIHTQTLTVWHIVNWGFDQNYFGPHTQVVYFRLHWIKCHGLEVNACK